MSRLAPSELVCDVVDGIAGITACYPNVQPQGTAVPAVVYELVAQQTEPSFDGPAPVAQILRVDVRGVDPGELENYGKDIIRGILAAGRLRQELGAFGQYDHTTKYHQHILTLSVRF